MKPFSRVVLGLALLAAFTVPGSAQSGGERRVDKASPQLMTGRVVQVDPSAKTFAIAAGGRTITFGGGKLAALPQVGQTVEVSYTGTGTPGAPLEASNLNYSKSNVN
jgi:hypothetical protein